MSSALVSQITERFADKSTDELTAIWLKNDRVTWSDETFEAIGKLLSARGAILPRQDPAILPPPRKPIWRSLVGALARIVLFIGSTAAATAVGFIAYPIPRVGRMLGVGGAVVAAMAFALGIAGMRISLRGKWAIGKERLTVVFIAWLVIAILGAGSCLFAPFSRLSPSSEGLLFAAGVLLILICFLLMRSYRPRLILGLAILLVLPLTVAGLPSAILMQAAMKATDRSAQLSSIQPLLAGKLLESEWRASVSSPMRNSGLRSNHIILCLVEKDGGIRASSLESLLPEGWEAVHARRDVSTIYNAQFAS